MKFLTAMTLIPALLLASAAHAGVENRTCLLVSQIAGSDSDGKTLFLRMRNGQRWEGQLKGACSQMKWGGYSWDVRGGEVCENAQSINIPRGGPCVLGKLSPAAADKTVR
jgi:hypothetical protein